MRREKEPSLLRKLITIYWEQAKRRKALRMLQKQTWSVEFLSMLLVKASKAANDNLKMSITSRDGVKIEVSYDKALQSPLTQQLDDSVFNHLDDDMAVQDFIYRNSVR